MIGCRDPYATCIFFNGLLVWLGWSYWASSCRASAMFQRPTLRAIELSKSIYATRGTIQQTSSFLFTGSFAFRHCRCISQHHAPNERPCLSSADATMPRCGQEVTDHRNHSNSRDETASSSLLFLCLGSGSSTPQAPAGRSSLHQGRPAPHSVQRWGLVHAQGCH